MLIKQFFHGFIRIHILYHASKNAVCGVWIMKELRRHGYKISPGLLYPTLHALEEEGYLKSEKKTEQGKMKKYYTTTSKGSKILENSRLKIKELVGEVME